MSLMDAMELLLDWISAAMHAEYDVNTNRKVENSMKTTTLTAPKFDVKCAPRTCTATVPYSVSVRFSVADRSTRAPAVGRTNLPGPGGQVRFRHRCYAVALSAAVFDFGESGPTINSVYLVGTRLRALA